MKYRVIGLLAASALLGGVFQGGAAEKVARTYAEREAFIKQFHRIPLNTTPGDAMLLRILARASKAKRGVEVGSATGYGAINMGLAFEANGGRLYTIDIDPDMVRKCRENKRDYFKYFKAIEPKLTKGAVIVADNVIRSARQMQDFLSYFKGNEDYEMVIVRASMEKHDGMAVIYKLR